MPKISCLFFGTPKFSIPSLKSIFDSGLFEIRGVITQIDKPKGRSKTATSPPVKTWAQNHNLSVFQPDNLSKKNFEKDILQFLPIDLILIVAYGKIIPPWITEISKFGALNLHPSLLPKFRGPSPIQSAIIAREKETGVSIILIDDELDHGPILLKKPVPIQKSETYLSLHDRLSEIGAELLLKTAVKYARGEIKSKEQNHEEATFTKMLAKEDGLINWGGSSEDIDAKIRALNPWPGTSTLWNGKQLIILEANPTNIPITSSPGTILQIKNSLFAATNDYMLEIKMLKLEGGKSLSSENFLRGHQNIINARLPS